MKRQQTAERRQVTVLHVDIVNSTALVDELDPEEVMGLMQSYVDSCQTIIDEFQGSLAGYTGDGFEAYFGYPIAREDAAPDAVNAAIRIGEMLADGSSFPFDCRIGIATGRVVVDQPGIRAVGRNLLAFGPAPHLAARLQQAASPGHVLVDRPTMKLCESRFDFRSIGSIRLKGFAEDFEVFELGQPLQPGQRFSSSRLSPYVGRQAELQLLSSRWQSCLGGNGQVVVALGEPGIGKSRLVHEFQQTLAKDEARIFRLQCLSQFTATPLHPWTHNIERLADVHRDDNIAVKQAKISDYLRDHLWFSPDIIDMSMNLMGLSQNSSYLDYSPTQMLSKLQSTLADYLLACAKSLPLLILVEDVQWVDASTLNLLQSFAALIETERVMLVMTTRPENAPNFRLPYVTTLPLNKLDNRSVSELISKLAAPRQPQLSDSVSEKIKLSSGGNPLYVEHLTEHYLERATSEEPDQPDAEPDDLVPNQLQGSLMERIDKAGKSKEVAQLASVIGKDFDLKVLIALSEKAAGEVQRQLNELTDLKILVRFRHGERDGYEFSHALLRDAVYSSLLRSARREMHLKIAHHYSHNGAETVPPEIVAHHFECGDDRRNALHCWLAAGQHALRSGATEDAANLLSKALKMSATLSEEPEILDDLTSLNLSYGLALNASRGVAANPLQYFRKAEELSTRLGNIEQTLEALDWQFGLHFNAGELSLSKAPAEKMKQLGLSLGHRTAIAWGCQGLGMACFMLGDFVGAREEFELGLKAGTDWVSGVHCYPSMSLSYLAWTLFVLGHAAEAEASADRAIDSARQESSHALATALSNCCYVYQCIGAIDKVYERTAELVEHTRRHGEQIYLRRALIIRSWADCVTGNDDQMIQPITEHIDFLLRSKEEIEVTFLLGVLAEAQIRHGRYSDAQSSLDKALEIARNNQENFYLPELFRLKAQLAAGDGETFAPRDGDDFLAMARQTAESQRAKAWLDRLDRDALQPVTVAKTL
jgi:class 3 adenylate cyclase/tetratricopeptide (TPR) repeat protein